MPWGRIHDGAYKDPKLLALSDAASRMWWCGISYAQDALTDGFIPDYIIHTFGVRAKNKEAVADELCRVLVAGKGPLWHKVDGGYRIHDFLDWNDSRDTVLAERKRNKDRKERFNRKRGLGRVPPAFGEHVVNAVDEAVEAAYQQGVRTHSGTRSGTLFETPPGRAPECIPGCVPGRDPEREPERRSEHGSTYHGTCTNQIDSSVRSTCTEKQEHAPGAFVSVENAEDDRALQVRLLRRLRSSETVDGRPAVHVITAMARDVLLRHRTETDDGELSELLKSACAKANLRYDATSVGEGIDRARAQLRRRRLL